jgi:hypothetical protein
MMGRGIIMQPTEHRGPIGKPPTGGSNIPRPVQEVTIIKSSAVGRSEALFPGWEDRVISRIPYGSRVPEPDRVVQEALLPKQVLSTITYNGAANPYEEALRPYEEALRPYEEVSPFSSVKLPDGLCEPREMTEAEAGSLEKYIRDIHGAMWRRQVVTVYQLPEGECKPWLSTD